MSDGSNPDYAEGYDDGMSDGQSNAKAEIERLTQEVS